MSSLIDDVPEGVNTPEFSVSELSGAVKRMVEGEFGHVRVRGEVGRVSRPRSGHVYLDLKDDRAVLAGVMWKGVAQRLTTQPEEGMEVVATGRLTTFPGQSKYQIVIEDIAPAGVGALMAMLEKRKAALAAEGLFAEEKKRALPFLPRVIGVVTSPSGAVIRDILHRLGERFPTRVLVWPVAVQGERCAAEVAAAINGFSAMEGALRPDVVIVARGGGSIEDLWGFNEEVVVRAAAASTIPLISAVGHETDWTLIDLASDLRAPTPSAAAERAVPVRAELAATLAALEARRLRSLTALTERARQRLSDLARAFPRPDRLLEDKRQRLDNAILRLPRIERLVEDRRQMVRNLSLRLLRPSDLIERRRHALERLAGRLPVALGRACQQGRVTVGRLSGPLSPIMLRNRFERASERLDLAARRLSPAMTRQMRREADRFAATRRLYESLHYEQTLKRGFAVIRQEGQIVAQSDALARDREIEIQFRDGRVTAAIGNPPTVEPEGARAKPSGRQQAKKAKPRETPDQGSLF